MGNDHPIDLCDSSFNDISAIFLSAGFVVVYAEAKRTNTIQGLDLKYQTLAVSFVNGISLLVLFGFRFFFLCCPNVSDFQSHGLWAA